MLFFHGEMYCLILNSHLTSNHCIYLKLLFNHVSYEQGIDFIEVT